MRLRVGLVGLGDAWHQRHRPALHALADRFEVRAICEPVGHRARQAAGEFGAMVVDGFQAIVQREDIDAIMMLSAGWYGPLPILAACESGKAVYCTTVVDLSSDPSGTEQVRTVKQRVDESGIAFMAEFLCRQSPGTLRLKELIATRLGPPRLLFCHQRHGAAESAAGGEVSRSDLDSTTQELVELVDWCRYVVGKEPTCVTGMAHKRVAESAGEDYEMLSLDFSDWGRPGTGPLAQISCGRYIPAGWQEAISYRPLAALQVSCRHGIAFIDLPSTLIWFDEAGRHQESLESERPVGEQLLIQFHRAVTSLVRKTCDLEDAFRAASIVQEARKSFREGRRGEL
jgi:predicted dehydrogenase